MKKDGGSAFPIFLDGGIERGMSLRDYFAAAAMQGLMARFGAYGAGTIAHVAYIVADAMIAERDK
jgi:hypothetical protein